jgi:hypothetical protein
LTDGAGLEGWLVLVDSLASVNKSLVLVVVDAGRTGVQLMFKIHETGAPGTEKVGGRTNFTSISSQTA